MKPSMSTTPESSDSAGFAGAAIAMRIGLGQC
jgi:hypothetical protein